MEKQLESRLVLFTLLKCGSLQHWDGYTTRTFFVWHKKFYQMAYLYFFFYKIFFQFQTPLTLLILKLGYMFIITFFLVVSDCIQISKARDFSPNTLYKYHIRCPGVLEYIRPWLWKGFDSCFALAWIMVLVFFSILTWILLEVGGRSYSSLYFALTAIRSPIPTWMVHTWADLWLLVKKPEVS